MTRLLMIKIFVPLLLTACGKQLLLKESALPETTETAVLQTVRVSTSSTFN